MSVSENKIYRVYKGGFYGELFIPPEDKHP